MPVAGLVVRELALRPPNLIAPAKFDARTKASRTTSPTHSRNQRRAMSVSAPHFHLYSASTPGDANGEPGDWRFVLEASDGSSKVEVVEREPEIRGERLELLAVVRGLEALEQPSRVTLFTPSRYVTRGISTGLADWRDNDWQWERHGEMAPVKNRDLWQRVDRALEYHRVECKVWRFDAAEEPNPPQASHAAQQLPRRPAPQPHVRLGGFRARERQSDLARPSTIQRRTAPRQVAAPELKRRQVARPFDRKSRQRLRLRVRRSMAERAESLWVRVRQIVAPLFGEPWRDERP